MRYFNKIRTQEGATKRWRTLAKKHHPDVGGDAETMAEINRQYKEKLAQIAGKQTRRERATYEANRKTRNAGNPAHDAPKTGQEAPQGGQGEEGEEVGETVRSDMEPGGVSSFVREVLDDSELRDSVEETVRVGAHRLVDVVIDRMRRRFS